MSIDLISKDKQCYGAFNNGEIVENKPIGFPHDKGGLQGYSNLFYWAFGKAIKESTIGLHPHKGFEIVTYVIKGNIKHYDTKTLKWTTLDEGGFQVIQAGTGIEHAEQLLKDAEIFQIWLDPNLNESLRKTPKYRDYSNAVFPIEQTKSATTKTIVGKNSPVQILSEGLEIKDIELHKSESWDLNSTYIYSIYVITGKLFINNQETNSNDFIRIKDQEKLELQCTNNARIFVIRSPKNTSYKTYLNT